jgi:ribosomal-protein-alanine N-acetyltransferase
MFPATPQIRPVASMLSACDPEPGRLNLANKGKRSAFRFGSLKPGRLSARSPANRILPYHIGDGAFSSAPLNMRQTPALETARLLLRPIELADAEQLQRVFPQWEVVRYLAARVPWPYPPDGAIAFLRDIALPSMARGEAWCWTLRLKSDPARIVGGIDLYTKENDNRGFWLVPELHGRGLMTEAADAVTDFWFEMLQFPVLRTSKAASNIASRRVSEKQGMRLVATAERDYVSGRMLSEIWEITAAEWRARKHKS